MPRRLITTAELAETYGISLTTVHRWIREGRINAYRVGPRFLRVDADEVERQLVVPARGGAA